MECNFGIYTIRWQNVKIYKSQKCLRELLPFQRYNSFKLLASKKYVKVMECNFRNYTNRRQMSKIYTVICYICDIR